MGGAICSFRDDQHRARTEHSYRVEASVYERYADGLRKDGATVADYWGTQWGSDDDATAAMVLSDLAPNSNVNALHGRSDSQQLCLSYEQARHALDWLAKYHAHFWIPPSQTEADSSEHVATQTASLPSGACSPHSWCSGAVCQAIVETASIRNACATHLFGAGLYSMCGLYNQT